MMILGGSHEILASQCFITCVSNVPRRIVQLSWVSDELIYSSNMLLKNEAELKVSGEMAASNPEATEPPQRIVTRVPN